MRCFVLELRMYPRDANASPLQTRLAAVFVMAFVVATATSNTMRSPRPPFFHVRRFLAFAALLAPDAFFASAASATSRHGGPFQQRAPLSPRRFRRIRSVRTLFAFAADMPSHELSNLRSSIIREPDSQVLTQY